MPMAVRLVLAGHSHIHALGAPGHRAGEPPQVVPLPHPQADLAVVTGERDAAYWHALVEASRDRRAALIWAGNQHYAHFTFHEGRPFDFVLAGAPDLPLLAGAAIVPEAMVRATFEPTMAHLRGLLERIHKVSAEPAIVIGTPPPKGDPVRFSRNLDKLLVEMAKAANIGDAIGPDALTAVPVMVKLWRLMQAMLAESARAAGASFASVPPRLVTAEGTLADAHWAGDATHANHAYGKRMLTRVVRHAERTERAP